MAEKEEQVQSIEVVDSRTGYLNKNKGVLEAKETKVEEHSFVAEQRLKAFYFFSCYHENCNLAL